MKADVYVTEYDAITLTPTYVETVDHVKQILAIAKENRQELRIMRISEDAIHLAIDPKYQSEKPVRITLYIK